MTTKAQPHHHHHMDSLTFSALGKFQVFLLTLHDPSVATSSSASQTTGRMLEMLGSDKRNRVVYIPHGQKHRKLNRISTKKSIRKKREQ